MLSSREGDFRGEIQSGVGAVQTSLSSVAVGCWRGVFFVMLVLFMMTISGRCVAAVSAQERVTKLEKTVELLLKRVEELEGQRTEQVQKYQTQQTSIDGLSSQIGQLEIASQSSMVSYFDKLHIGGYGEIHANFTEGTESDKMDFHRLVLYLGYDFADWIKFHSETELEHAFVKDTDTDTDGSSPNTNTSGGEISLEQAYVDFLFSDAFNIRAGRLLTPVGIINQNHEPTLFNGVERPNFSKYIIPTTWSSDGVGIFGSFNPSLSYEAYVVAGLDGNKFTSSGIRDGRIKSKQSLNEVAFTGRLDWRPYEDALADADQSLRLGVSGYYGGLDNVDGGGGSGKDGEIAMSSADFEYSISRFDFRGVIAHTNIDGAANFNDTAGSKGEVAEEMFGWYLEGAYHFWPDEWKVGKLEKSDATVFVRYEEYDTQYKMPTGVAKDQTKDIDELTFGVNFYLTPDFVVKADYQLRDDASGNGKDDQFNLGLGWTF